MTVSEVPPYPRGTRDSLAQRPQRLAPLPACSASCGRPASSRAGANSLMLLTRSVSAKGWQFDSDWLTMQFLQTEYSGLRKTWIRFGTEPSPTAYVDGPDGAIDPEERKRW